MDHQGDSQHGDYACERPAGRHLISTKDVSQTDDEVGRPVSWRTSLMVQVYDRLEVILALLGVTLSVTMVIVWTSLISLVAAVGPTTRGGFGLMLLCGVLFYLAASFSYELRHRRWLLLLALSIFWFGEAVHFTV